MCLLVRADILNCVTSKQMEHYIAMRKNEVDEYMLLEQNYNVKTAGRKIG